MIFVWRQSKARWTWSVNRENGELAVIFLHQRVSAVFEVSPSAAAAAVQVLARVLIKINGHDHGGNEEDEDNRWSEWIQVTQSFKKTPLVRGGSLWAISSQFSCSSTLATSVENYLDHYAAAASKRVINHSLLQRLIFTPFFVVGWPLSSSLSPWHWCFKNLEDSWTSNNECSKRWSWKISGFSTFELDYRATLGADLLGCKGNRSINPVSLGAFSHTKNRNCSFHWRHPENRHFFRCVRGQLLEVLAFLRRWWSSWWRKSACSWRSINQSPLLLLGLDQYFSLVHHQQQRRRWWRLKP